MRYILPVMGLCILAACAPPAPDSGRGVGFEDYDTYIAEKRTRDAELRGRAAPQEQVISGESGGVAQTPGQQTAAAGTTGTPAATTDNPGISNSQDFEAVSARESIESDADKLKAQRDQYVFVKPKPLPQRRSKSTVAKFALSTTHGVGERRYRRSALGGLSTTRKCQRYRTPDDAQQAFLDAGGPERDRLGVDPDGDGFACSWTPETYRRMVN